MKNSNERLLYILAWLVQEYEEGDGEIPDGLYNAARIAVAEAGEVKP